MKPSVFKTMLLAMVFLCFKENAFAQTGARTEKSNRSNEKTETSVTAIKNPDAENIVVQGIELDKRIVKYYPPGELAKTPPEKIATLRHIYIDSYELLNKSDQNAACKSKLKEHFDLGLYNYLRHEDKRVEVEVNFEGCLYKISLFSWNEVDKMK